LALRSDAAAPAGKPANAGVGVLFGAGLYAFLAPAPDGRREGPLHWRCAVMLPRQRENLRTLASASCSAPGYMRFWHL
ncbi:hypothetical protein, partial [Cronobacter malonaticus]|uniref:hypothetical protein n=1 Tax=Cronobacter malonaticus TaxID=413503 RepID=UPI0018F868C5